LRWIPLFLPLTTFAFTLLPLVLAPVFTAVLHAPFAQAVAIAAGLILRRAPARARPLHFHTVTAPLLHGHRVAFSWLVRCVCRLHRGAGWLRAVRIFYGLVPRPFACGSTVCVFPARLLVTGCYAVTLRIALPFSVRFADAPLRLLRYATRLRFTALPLRSHVTLPHALRFALQFITVVIRVTHGCARDLRFTRALRFYRSVPVVTPLHGITGFCAAWLVAPFAILFPTVPVVDSQFVCSVHAHARWLLPHYAAVTAFTAPVVTAPLCPLPFTRSHHTAHFVRSPLPRLPFYVVIHGSARVVDSLLLLLVCWLLFCRLLRAFHYDLVYRWFTPHYRTRAVARFGCACAHGGLRFTLVTRLPFRCHFVLLLRSRCALVCLFRTPRSLALLGFTLVRLHLDCRSLPFTSYFLVGYAHGCLVFTLLPRYAVARLRLHPVRFPVLPLLYRVWCPVWFITVVRYGFATVYWLVTRIYVPDAALRSFTRVCCVFALRTRYVTVAAVAHLRFVTLTLFLFVVDYYRSSPRAIPLIWLLRTVTHRCTRLRSFGSVWFALLI